MLITTVSDCLIVSFLRVVWAVFGFGWKTLVSTPKGITSILFLGIFMDAHISLRHFASTIIFCAKVAVVLARVFVRGSAWGRFSISRPQEVSTYGYPLRMTAGL